MQYGWLPPVPRDNGRPKEMQGDSGEAGKRGNRRKWLESPQKTIYLEAEAEEVEEENEEEEEGEEEHLQKGTLIDDVYRKNRKRKIAISWNT
jgi:hypothetical protein